MVSLAERRHQLDMVQTYKILTGKDNVSRDNWFQMADSTGRVTRAAEDPFNLRIPQARLEVRRQFFSHRVPAHWNRIPPDLKAAATTNRFKNGYRRLRSRRDPTQDDG